MTPARSKRVLYARDLHPGRLSVFAITALEMLIAGPQPAHRLKRLSVVEWLLAEGLAGVTIVPTKRADCADRRLIHITDAGRERLRADRLRAPVVLVPAPPETEEEHEVEEADPS